MLLFISLFLAALHLCCGIWAFSSCATQTSHCGDFSCGAWDLGHVGFSSCCTWIQLPHGMWNLPGSGTKHQSPALAGGFLTTGLPGKLCLLFLTQLQHVLQTLLCSPFFHLTLWRLFCHYMGIFLAPLFFNCIACHPKEEPEFV